MDHHACAVLEFERVCAFLENLAQSAGGRRMCRQTRPRVLLSEVQHLQQETSEMLAEIQQSGPLGLGGVHDIRGDVERTRIHNFHLEPEQLLRIAETLETAATMKMFFDGIQETAPALFRHAEPLCELRSLTENIRACISPRGEILDSASDRLKEFRRQIRSIRARIIKNLEKYLQDVDMNFAVQDDFITLRNSRYVIPVRSDRKTAIPGVVHDQSQSKATFFVEPLDILELNNSLQLTQREAQYEEIHILTDLTRTVQEQQQAILENLRILEGLDVINARACLSRAMHACRPTVSPDAEIELKQCRHPMLTARFKPVQADPADSSEQGSWTFDRLGIVAIDIIKKPNVSTLVITGANAGGKTVALKTLGLLVLMHQSGMHIPAAPNGRIALFEKLFADIGDEQNIETSLSTFSAHMARIKNALEAATPRSLVLLDELGSGTDPAEGGALAVAILDHLRTLGCTTIATTHLNLLKTYAFSHANAENVSVEFDPRTHRPLYRLVYGLPGFSNALSIARSIGIPDSVLEAAGHHIGHGDRHAAELIRALERTEKKFQQQCTILQMLQERSTLAQDACRRLLEAMQARRDRSMQTFEEKARAMLRESENRLRSIIKQHRQQLRQKPDSPSNADPLQQVHSVKRELYRHFPAKAPAAKPLERVEPGQRVTVVSLKKCGTVATVDTAARRAEIAIGNMRVKAGFHELAPAPRNAAPERTKRPHSPPPEHYEAIQETRINVIGLRVDEALPRIEKSIDTAIINGTHTVEIIHGRGTGRLMRAIHDHLKDHPQIARMVPGSAPAGTGGITRVELK